MRVSGHSVHSDQRMGKPAVATRKTTTRGGGQTLGYRRASTADQRLDRQLMDVEVDRTFDDHASGGSADRPGLTALLDHMREGDTVVVHSLDRLARSLPDLLALVERITPGPAQRSSSKKSR